MKSKKLALSTTALCFILLLLFSPLILPIRAAETFDSASKGSLLNFQKLPDGSTLIPFGSATMIVKYLPNNGVKFVLVNADGKNTTFEVINRKISNQTSIQQTADLNGILTEKVVFVNGKEAYKLPVTNRITPSDVSYNQNMQLDSVTYYWWDNVYFGQGDPLFQYPHPDRDYYSIPTYANWGTVGNNLIHFQFSDSMSGFLAGAGAGVFAAEMGALIGAGLAPFSGPIAAIVTAIAVPIIYEAIFAFEESYILDEESCLWFWISQAFTYWLYQNQGWLIVLADLNPVAAYVEVQTAFDTIGYLRVGSLPFVDALGIGQPGPPPPTVYVSSLAGYGTYLYGGCSYPSNIIGEPDGNYAELYGGNYGDGGYVRGWTDETSGHIYIYGYSYTGYETHLYIWVSYNNNYDWESTSIPDQTVYGDQPRWIDCGWYSGTFRYIAIVAIDDNGMSARLEIDSIRVQP